jgi:hypothetical protein
MKKNLLLLGVAVAALSSCTNNEVIEMAENRAIGFESFVGKPTKAVTEITDAGIRSFCVYGGYNDMTHVFNNQEVTSENGTEWSYTPTRYWVAGKDYKFAAYAPKAVENKIETDFNNGHLNVKDYVSNPTLQYDLIYSGGITKTPSAEETGTVNFQFEHLLSMIKFTFESGFTKDISVTISDLKVFGMNSTATYTGSSESWGDATVVVTTPGFEEMSGKTVAEIPSEGEETKAESAQFVVIPQTSPDVTVSFKATVNDAKGGEVVAKVLSGTITAPIWKKGLRYNYTIKISGDDAGLKPIVIGDPTVTGWPDFTGGTTVDVQ